MSPIEGPGNDSGKAMRPCHPPTFPWIPMYLGLRLNVKSISLGPGHLVCLLRWVVKVLNHHSVSHGLQLQFKFSHFMKGKWPSKPLSSHLRCRQTTKASMIPKCSPSMQLSQSPFYLNPVRESIQFVSFAKRWDGYIFDLNIHQMHQWTNQGFPPYICKVAVVRSVTGSMNLRRWSSWGSLSQTSDIFTIYSVWDLKSWVLNKLTDRSHEYDAQWIS